jgi:hypothetical protein
MEQYLLQSHWLVVGCCQRVDQRDQKDLVVGLEEENMA